MRLSIYLMFLATLAGALGAITPPAMAAVYHVSTGGADGNDGLSPETAWASLGRVNAAPLQPGDHVLFRSGDVWRGQLVPVSGDESAPVTYAAYGSSEKPLLLGSVNLSDPKHWERVGENIWGTREPEAIGPELLPNGEFAQGAEAWNLHTEQGARFTMTTGSDGAPDAPESLAIACDSPGSGGSHAQFYTDRFPVAAGSLYRLSFRIKASAELNLNWPALMKSGPPWTHYAAWKSTSKPAAEAEWREFSCYYLAYTTADDARITFFLGDMMPEGVVLTFDHISLHECGAESMLANDVGNIIFDHEAECGVKVWEENDLDAQGEYWYDENRHVVKLYSTANPGERYAEIECAIREHIIDQTNRHHVVYDGLALKYGAAHGIGGANTHHIIVRNCDLGFIGGGDQMGGEKTVRYGNGIEFWAAAHDHLVEGCRLWEIYDAALTNQSSGPRTPQYNITYRNNTIWNCEYSFEYWNRPEDSETYNIVFEHNTCYNAGGGWGHAQRPDPSGRHLCFYTSPAPHRDFHVRHNIFCGAVTNAFYAPQWPRTAIDALSMDHNCWWQPSGAMLLLNDQPMTAAEFGAYQHEYNKEPHSIVNDPLFIEPAACDFRIKPESPCLPAHIGVEAIE